MINYGLQQGALPTAYKRKQEQDVLQYQGNMLDNMGKQGGLYGQQQGLGDIFQGQGLGQMGQWGGRANQAYGAAAGIAAREPSWYADRAAVSSNQAFDESKGAQERALSRMGINPNSGRFVGQQTQWGLARAAAEAGARTRAQQDAEATTFSRQQQLAGMANQQYGQGAGMLGQAGSQYGQAASGYGALANSYGGLAGEAAENLKVREAQARGGGAQAQIDSLLSQMRGMQSRAMTSRMAAPRAGRTAPAMSWEQVRSGLPGKVGGNQSYGGSVRQLWDYGRSGI